MDPVRVPLDSDKDKEIDKAKYDRSKELDDIREVLKTAAGRRFYYRAIEHCKPFNESFVVGMADVTANNEGRRMVGNWLWSELLEADTEKWNQMLREHKSSVVVKQIIKENTDD